MAKPTSPYANIDRTATVESLQHVAGPVDIEQAVRDGIRRIRETEERWPAASADLLEFDAVPESTDSDAPSDIHARTLARARL